MIKRILDLLRWLSIALVFGSLIRGRHQDKFEAPAACPYSLLAGRCSTLCQGWQGFPAHRVRGDLGLGASGTTAQAHTCNRRCWPPYCKSAKIGEKSTQAGEPAGLIGTVDLNRPVEMRRMLGCTEVAECVG